jgi:DNA replication and repair protein RecF
MHIDRLVLGQFRNVTSAELAWPGSAGATVVLTGANAQGKTNLLEAIYFLAALRSFRPASTGSLVQFGAASAFVQARVAGAAGHTDLALVWEGDKRRQSVDGVACTPARFAGHFQAVAFTPFDLDLTTGAPDERRRALDRAIFVRHPVYLDEWRRYQQALKARNALLRAGGEPDALEAELAVWDDAVATHGAAVMARRAAWVAELSARVAGLYAAMTGAPAAEVPGLRYAPGLPSALVAAGPVFDNGQPVLDLAATIRDALGRRRAREWAVRSTTVGPHRDDLLLTLAGQPVRETASQGQRRSLVLALKMAEIDALTEAFGEPPVVLLDDVVSELDETRRGQLLRYLGASPAQVIITTTELGPAQALATRGDLTVYAVEGGAFTRA